jgi:hypothetical protein
MVGTTSLKYWGPSMEENQHADIRNGSGSWAFIARYCWMGERAEPRDAEPDWAKF